jgi:flagellar biosynthesis anti-sigma factor FlgM
MKIHNTNVQPQEIRPEAGPQAAKDAKAVSAYVGRPGAGQGRTAGGETDAVSLSSLSREVRALAAAQEAEQERRIAELSALVESGNYVVDPAKLSGRIVDDALLGGL